VILRRATNAAAFLVKFGPVRFIKECGYQLYDHWFERRLGVETGGLIKLPDIGIHNEEFLEYAPIGYYAIQDTIRRIPLPRETVSFVDYGSGKGRAVLVAATYPFRKAIGVEISEKLNRVAEQNIARMKHRKAKVVEALARNAVDFTITDDINLIYMANPFRGETLEIVIGKILASYRAAPRPIYLIYFNKVYFEQLIANPGYELIKRIYLSPYYPNYSCGIYVIGDQV
jgi:16S rRNA G966 N2-methylase RsmD